MATPSPDMIETYMSLTGASHSLALQKLEEYGGNLNEAVNAHFSEGDRHITNPVSSEFPQYNFHHMSNQNQNQVAPLSPVPPEGPPSQGLLPLLSAARSFKPSSLLDLNYSRDLFNRIGSALTGRAPLGPHPVEFSRGNEQPYSSGQRPTIQGVTGTELNASHPYGNDVENEMIQAAIEASKQEAEVGYLNMQNRALNAFPGNGLPGERAHQDNDDFDRAVSLSLKTAEQEKAIREQQLKEKNPEPGTSSIWKRGMSSHQDGAETAQLQLVSQESQRDAGNHLHQGNFAIPCEELGNISSKELDEAIMLETALFGKSSYAPNFPGGPNRNLGTDLQPARGPSSSSLSARQLREQQDDEYIASLLADKEKERNAVNEAGTCHLKEGSADNKKTDPLEFERRLAAKNASLPCEPASDDENAITLLFRMPNGGRLSRRFRKSDKLQLLFDFIDVGRVVKPGTYRVVRSYPWHAFSVDESLLTLSELGLTNKQEALFLELI